MNGLPALMECGLRLCFTTLCCQPSAERKPQAFKEASDEVRMVHGSLYKSSEIRFLHLSQEMSLLEKSFPHLSTRNHLKSLRQWQRCYRSELNCPICLQATTCPVETNCGHLFCGSCLIEYWKHGPWLEAISCPLCRQKVILLYNMPCENLPDKPSKQIVYDIRDYNKRFSGQPRPFTDYLYDMPLLVNLAVRGIFTLGGLVWIFFLRVVICCFGTFMCLTSSLDLMPEPLCGILGLFDDLVVVFLLLICMINICSQMESEGANMTSSTAQNILLES
ncbi:E3 ubiquitin-protein ligase RNF170-like [Zootoca vivipara]|uniref:E3 ubiquitin-protein ligase RNF170-like n=1 Tax=Zootoca vivipara TaxID=8524 RepID=UPI00159047E5|nr:E3 ubiquitin-protein ligase RNF170-like [Zootoca vivipara]